MGEERRKQKAINPYTGQSVPIVGSKPLADIKRDRKFERVFKLIKLLIFVFFLLFVLLRDSFPYWIEIIREFGVNI